MGWIKRGGTAAAAVDPLNGKRWGLIGSSSTEPGYPNGTTKFTDYIISRTGIVQFNRAASGSYLVSNQPNYVDDTRIQRNQLKQLDDLPTDLDIITPVIGANDDRYSVPLGAFGSTNQMEFYGAVDLMCRKLLDKFPSKKLGIISAHYMPSDNAKRESIYYKAIEEVAAYYAIPFINMVKEGRCPYSYQPFKDMYLVPGDLLHMNAGGNELLSYATEAFLRKVNGE